MDVVPGTHTFKNKLKTLKAYRKERHVLSKMNIVPTPGTVTNLLNVLKWPPLQKRRKVARLTMMFKVVSGQSAVQIPSYITQKKRQGTRQFHPKKFIEVGARTNKYKHSFLAQTIRDCNSLPKHVIEDRHVPYLNNADPGHFLILHLVLYFNTCTCTFAHLPFADYSIRIRRFI